MPNKDETTLVSHLEALRGALLKIIIATALLYPVAYWLAPHVIRLVVQWSFPEGSAQLHYFAPMEVFWVELKLALVLALIMAYPWNILQIWMFLLPALYNNERKALGWWFLSSSLLFGLGIAFCIGLILPMLMAFSASFSSAQLQPMLGLANFLNLAGWLSLAFGLMFQAPVLVLVAVRFGLISAKGLSRKRPYIITLILIAAAILTPPDVVSQVMLAVPTWLLFELGVFLAKRLEKKQ